MNGGEPRRLARIGPILLVGLINLYFCVDARIGVAQSRTPTLTATPTATPDQPPTPTPGSGGQPANDNFADVAVIFGLPFSDSVDNTGATTEPGEPQNCDFLSRTVWYSFTPTVNTMVRADMAGSTFFDTHLNVYEAVGPGFGGLSFLNCAEFGSSLTFTVQAGTTYYLQAGDVFTGGGILEVNLQEILPPPNDDFTDATVIGGLPFTDRVDTTAASFESGEPTPSCFNAQNGTVWYAFTPAASGSVSASAGGSFFPAVVAAYTGNSLASLTEVGCRLFSDVLTLDASAGATYFFQVAGIFGESGPLQFQLDVTPPPVANFSYSPSDPSTYETVQFYDNSYDPGQVGIQSFTWNFGDGATATGSSPTHRYAADGDYTVQETVTTLDGRTASTSQTVHVATHDVAITKFSVPNAAKAGQTRAISVGVNSRRYPETVQVALYKSVPGNCYPSGCFQSVGWLTQFVPVRPSNRTTDFNFSYTFTSEDAAIGKVTFRAVASIIEARDALSADNEAISSPTKVGR